MYTSSSLSPLSLSLTKMSVSDSFPSLSWKQSSSDSIPSCNTYFPISAENSCRLHACVGVMVLAVVVVFGGFAADEEKRLHIGNYSQKMPQCDDYKDFLKKNLNKADIIR